MNMTRSQFLPLYCGNIDCPSRSEEMPDGTIGRTWTIDVSQVPDGEAWRCPDCTTR